MSLLDLFNPQTQSGSALQRLAEQDSAYRNDEHMQKVFAANPKYAQALYGTKNQMQDNELNKQLLGIKLQSLSSEKDLPAALQLTNEYLRAQNTGDSEKANALLMFAKALDKGVVLDGTGKPSQLANYGKAVGEIEAAKATLKQQAEKNVDLRMNPQIREAEAQSGARGQAVGEAEGAQDRKEVQAPAIDALIQEAKKILPNSTSGLGQQALTGAAKIVGTSTDSSKADARLKVLSAALTSTVPRFEGPQGVLDVELYKQAAADVANTSLPFEDRLAALDTMESLNKKYLADESPKFQDGATATNPQTGERIVFKNGKWLPAQ